MGRSCVAARPTTIEPNFVATARPWINRSEGPDVVLFSYRAVDDRTGEQLYVRDEETGEFWSPTLRPIRGAGPHVVRHGRGYSTFHHHDHGIAHELTVFVPPFP